ncbi:MAG: NAD(+)/NADH kinase [Alphaproteobacteria bacterium]|nr:NAD(+)/NADH kinase [Alphaproteobacteria bacterium]MCB9697655.1 NAD(+)/NADH kinase [Alphaproteobacteria bacterium]
MEPRCVVLTRPTPYEELIAHHGTHGHAEWFLSRQGRDLRELVAAHEQQLQAVDTVWRSIPSTWRSTRIERRDLDRFLFEPEDIVVAVGQDGLVANAAKYLGEQPVMGVNPGGFDGVLVRHAPRAALVLLPLIADRVAKITVRTRVQATTDDGQRLLALNEIYVGQRTHQSSRYTLSAAGREERQSSSGLIVATGTGCTGWAKSIANARSTALKLPQPAAPDLVFFVREAWPSKHTGATLVEGIVQDGGSVTVSSEMNEGGVFFGDGIESDPVDLPFARRVVLSRAEHGLHLL